MENIKWIDTATIVEKCFRKMNPRYYTLYPNSNYLKDIYNNDISHAIEKIFVFAVMNNWSTTSDDIIFLRQAYSQLHEKGYLIV